MIFDVPRITTSTRDSVSGVNSAVIYNVDYNRFEYHNGSSWVTFLSGQNSNTVWSFNSRTGNIIFQDSDIASLGDFTASGVLTITESILLGNSALKIDTTNISPNISGVVANSGSLLLKNDGTLWTKDGSSNTDWSPVQPREYTNEPTGFTVGTDGEVDRSSSTIAFNNSTREFTISVTSGYSRYYVFIQGKLFTKTISQSVTLPNTTGSYYIYFDETGDLVYTSNFDLEIIFKYAYVSIIYWNSTQNKAVYFGDERHGCVMDGHTHARIHQVDGAVYINGSALTGFTIDGNGSSNTHTQFAISSGQIRDEDILHTLGSKSNTITIPVLYRVGTEWRSVENANQKFHYNTRAYYNSVSDGSYGLTEVANNKFCLYHIVATNDKDNPYFSVMGLNQYDVKSTAREGALTEISQYTGLPFVEFVFIATIIFQTSNTFSNTGKSIIISTDTGGNYIDWRFSKTLNPSTASVNIHNNLGGIQGGSAGDYYHSNQPINTTDSVTFNNLTIVSGVTANGIINFNNIKYPNADGVSGQVMTTDGNGNISFTAITGGGDGTNAGTILDTYINSKTITINNNSTSNIQTIFSQAISGIYTFWVSSDPRIKGIFYFNENDPSNSILESISSFVSSKEDNSNTLNLYISSVNVIIQNKLGSNITLCIRRETTPLINPESGSVSISSHNNLYDLQGGGTNAYYHSNQPINIADAVTFAGITITLTTNSSTGVINNLTTSNIGGYRFTSASSATITGFANGSNGKLIYIHNASAINITIANASSSSSESNRILTGNSKNLILKPETSIILQYDATTSRWRILGGSSGNNGESPETIDLNNSNTTINLSSYPTTSLRLKNPAQITLSNGADGVWYTLAIVSDGSYSFTSEVRFPLNNAQPVPSSSNRIDVYSLHCINTTDGLKYLATFAYDYSGVTLP